MTTAFVTSFNHRSRAGVSEIVDLLTGEFGRAGLNATSCRALPQEATGGDVLIVVDEFSEPIVIDALEEFRTSHPGVLLVCVLTEFFAPETWARPPSLNRFKQPYQSFCFDNLLYVASFLTGRLKPFTRLKLRPPRLANYVFGLAGLLWLGLQKALRPATPVRKLRTFHERGYLWFRCIGLQSISDIFDAYLALHPDIASEPLATTLGTRKERIHTLLVPPPIVEKAALIDPELEFGIDLSGSINKYRKKELRRVVSLLQNVSPGGRFSYQMQRGFDDSAQRLLLSFNPPQSKSWKHSSPMRIVGAIKRGQVPVVTEKFGDHPAESLALLLPDNVSEIRSLVRHIAFERTAHLNSFWEKLQEYRRIAEENNKTIIRQLRSGSTSG